ncbi:MAG: UMP kinase [Rhizobiales bacterium]|nr:UMP kinase [Hyphomicrobiales bacterium]
MTKLAHKRVLLKVSGEALMGDQGHGIDMQVVARICSEIASARKLGAEICLVVGGGNIFRGVAGAAKGMDRGEADYMGMLATVMNAIALKGGLVDAGVDALVMSAIPMPTVCEPFARNAALAHLDAGRVVVFAAGTGNPFFTTDTAAALRAAEMGCDALMKGTSVDGVYSADPKIDPNATRFEQLTFADVLTKNLKIMDAASIALARDNNIPIIVFSIREPEEIVRVITGQGTSTLVTQG